MLITGKNIDVTMGMMSESNMTRHDQLGVPVDPTNPNKGLTWKDFLTLTDEDFEAIEEYFIQKTKK